VDVIPDTGVTVGVGGGGSGVSVGRAVRAGGSVAVMTSGGVAVGSSVCTEILQPVTKKLKAMRIEIVSFVCTVRF
jgi:hypothetical protein